MPIASPVAPWSVTDKQTAAIATATKAAVANKSHYITMAHALVDTGVAVLAELRDGTTVLHSWSAGPSAPPVYFDPPLKITKAALASLTLAAGAGGVVGAATLFGFTEEQ